MRTNIRQQWEKLVQKSRLAGDGPNCPIYYVSHDEALAFCAELTKQERGAGRLPKDWEFNLPTEAQWEYACRAGTTTVMSFGDKVTGSQANFNALDDGGRFFADTMAVGSYRANDWGLCDMHGNVAEWCRDSYSEKLPGGTDPEAKPVVAASTVRVNRGGGWVNDARDCRSAEREWRYRTDRMMFLGFRVALIQAR